MPDLRIILDGDGAAQDLRERGLRLIHMRSESGSMRVAYLSGGMSSGKPSIGLIFELPDGRSYVVAEVSAALFCAAAAAIKGKAEKDGFAL